MSYTLHAPPGSFRAFPILIAAEYNGIDIQVVSDDSFDPKTIQTKSPTGKAPILETPSGTVLFSSHAIARYVANLRRDTSIGGSSMLEQAQIDAWLDFCAAELELPACVWYYPIAGYMPFHQEAYEKAKLDFSKALQVLESHLQKQQQQQYLVGTSLTLADIVVVSTLLYPFKLTASPSYLKSYPKVLKWFQTCIGQKEFVSVIGVTTLCQKELLAKGAKAVSDDVATAAVASSTTTTTTSSFDLATFQSTYQPNNASCMTKFWETYDKEHWSIWKCVYDYADDNEDLASTKDIVTEFMKKSAVLKDECFGVMHILLGSSSSTFEIEGLWLFKGEDPETMFGKNEDTSWFTWSQLGPDASDPVKAAVAEIWATDASSNTTVGGKAIQDTQVLK